MNLKTRYIGENRGDHELTTDVEKEFYFNLRTILFSFLFYYILINDEYVHNILAIDI